MIYGYARCSTNEELQDLNRQIRELIQLGAGEENIYREYESGMKNDRVELQRLLSAVEAGDTIVATEVSRITRSTKQLCEIIELAKDRHIKLVLGSFIVDCTKELDPMTEGMLKMMRVKSGLRNAKAKGVAIGRPATSEDRIPKIFFKYYPKYKRGEINKSEFAKLCSVSYPTIFKYISVVEN